MMTVGGGGRKMTGRRKGVVSAGRKKKGRKGGKLMGKEDRSAEMSKIERE
jgi:hypothetical protein